MSWMLACVSMFDTGEHVKDGGKVDAQVWLCASEAFGGRRRRRRWRIEVGALSAKKTNSLPLSLSPPPPRTPWGRRETCLGAGEERLVNRLSPPAAAGLLCNLPPLHHGSVDYKRRWDYRSYRPASVKNNRRRWAKLSVVSLTTPPKGSERLRAAQTRRGVRFSWVWSHKSAVRIVGLLLFIQ